MRDTQLDALRQRRAEIGREVSRLQAEDADLAIAEQVLRRFAGVGAKGGGAKGESAKGGGAKGESAGAKRSQPKTSASNGSPRASASAPGTQREYVLDALASAKTPWLRTRDILSAVKARWSVTIPEESARPLMSTMKREGAIVRRGRLVALAERAADVGRRK